MADHLTRRRFLQGTAAVTASLAVGACTQGSDDDVTAPTSTLPGAGTDGILVVITLAGGNDALNTVAPVDDPLYRSPRGDLALDPTAALDIGEGFALHPELVRSKERWDAGQLAVVHGVGFSGLDRSHFHCMDVWQAGDTHHVGSGWLGRWLDLGGSDPLDAVSVGPRLPLLVRGERRSGAAVPTGPFTLPGTPGLRTRLEGWSPGDGDPSDLADLVVRSTADLLTVVDSVAPLVTSANDDGTLSAQLETVAALIRGGMPTRAYAVELAGFDTHAQQGPTHAALLAELDAALGTFLDELADPRVTVLVYSEFGRRVAANGSAGTDHGQAGTVLLAGTVRPGHHGEPPPLDALVDGDLATTTDFRAVFGAVLEGVLGVEAGDVLPGAPPPLRLV